MSNIDMKGVNKLNPETLNEIFNRVIKHLHENDFSREEIQKRIDNYSDEQGNLDLYSMFALLASESRSYTELMLFNVLNILYSEGYIASTKRSDDNPNE